MSEQNAYDSSIDWDRPIMIGCCPSSGSTLLSVMLDSHPEVASGPELSLFAHPFFWRQEGPEWQERLLRYIDLGRNARILPEWSLTNGVCPYGELVYDSTLPWYGLDRAKFKEQVRESSCPDELIRRLYEPVLESRGKHFWAEKAPNNIYTFDAFLEHYPQGRVVYLVRDGRDVTCSLLRRGFGFKRALSIWLVETAIPEIYHDHPRVHRIRFEDLILNTREVITELLDFLKIAPEVDCVLNYLKKSSRMTSDPVVRGSATWHANPCQSPSTRPIGSWKKVLTQEQLTVMSAAYIAKPVECFPQLQGQTFTELLNRLGYEEIDAAKANSREILRLVSEENLLLSDDDYDKIDPTIFQERFVECDLESLFGSGISPDDFRHLEKTVKKTLLEKIISTEEKLEQSNKDREHYRARASQAECTKKSRGGLRKFVRSVTRLLR